MTVSNSVKSSLMLSNPRACRGWLMLEVLVGVLLVTIVMASFTPFTIHIRQAEQQQLKWLHRSEVAQAFRVHLVSQWRSIGWAGCSLPGQQILTIGNVNNLQPNRLISRQLDKSSDWLQASQIGVCQSWLSAAETSSVVTKSCHWKVGAKVWLASCRGGVAGRVEAIGKQSSLIRFSDKDVIGRSGLLLSHDPYFWYVAAGRSTEPAFWRTPQFDGSSLELWNGVRKLAIYPLLDADMDGAVDTLSTEYGAYETARVKALWVEVVLEDKPCSTNVSGQSRYDSFRGQIWWFQSDCQFVDNMVIPLS